MTFTIHGVNIELKYSFFLIVSLFLLCDKSGWAGLSLLAVSLHELAHIAAMKLTGAKIRSLTLCTFGVNIEREPWASGYGREALVYLAGPLCNLALAVLAAPFSQWSLKAFSAINLVMGLFQLIPILPLDGGQLLACLAGRAYSPAVAERASAIVGFFLLVPVAVASILLALRTGNFTLLILCGFLAFGRGR